MNTFEEEINDKYTCPICRTIFVDPKILISCDHSLCNNCLNELILNETSLQCCICRKAYNKKQIKDNEVLAKEIQEKKIKCKCKSIIVLNKYEEHIAICFEFNKHLKKNIDNIAIKDDKLKKTINRSTFNCPLCDSSNMDRKGLLKHASQKHPQGRAVCPICMVQPWGDPNYKTNLLAHLNLRHQFDYDTTVDYNSKEDSILDEILKKSLSDY